MVFIRAMTLVFNVQTVLVLLGLICMVVGIWWLFGFGVVIAWLCCVIREKAHCFTSLC